MLLKASSFMVFIKHNKSDKVYNKRKGMIKLRCKTVDTMLLRDMVPFQGTLKKRTPADRIAMFESLTTDGLLTPFMIWKSDVNYILDGHGRRESLLDAAIKDATILEQQFPVMFIEAETEAEARKAVIQICSTYGKITSSGLRDFTAPIADYKAPLIKRSVSLVKRSKVAEADTVIVRLKVKKSIVAELLGVMKKTPGVELY